MVPYYHTITLHHNFTTATSLHANILCGVGGCTCAGTGLRASLVDSSLATSRAVLPSYDKQVNIYITNTHWWQHNNLFNNRAIDHISPKVEIQWWQIIKSYCNQNSINTIDGSVMVTIKFIWITNNTRNVAISYTKNK